jgi:L-ascorbate metabolism protein UlaG (beta-lactamase superfamily)
MGFIIQGADRTIYYSGDTALHMDMQLIGSQHTLDAAFLCLGDNFTMGYQDALLASDMIKCDHVIGMHFDTFPYIKVDHEKVIQHFVEKGKKLVLPSIGESWDI